MVTLYFSGTGNSKYVSKYFSAKLGSECFSIEEDIDFKNKIISNEVVAFCYPIYGSCVPSLMREFVEKYKTFLNNKKIIILCTQLLFSGDGARVFTNLLKDVKYKVIYAEHINMPNNICNFFLLPVKNDDKIIKKVARAEKKLDRITCNIKNGVIKKKGFNFFSRFLGYICQRCFFPTIEKKALTSVKIDSRCIHCLKCVKCCPTKNLESVDGKIIQNGKCMSCYRCINLCPTKSITLFVNGKVKEQYKGIKPKNTIE